MIECKREFEPNFGTLYYKVVTLAEAREIVDRFKDVDKFTSYHLFFPEACLENTIGVLREKIRDSGDYLFIPLIYKDKYMDSV